MADHDGHVMLGRAMPQLDATGPCRALLGLMLHALVHQVSHWTRPSKTRAPSAESRLRLQNDPS